MKYPYIAIECAPMTLLDITNMTRAIVEHYRSARELLSAPRDRDDLHHCARLNIRKAKQLVKIRDAALAARN
jgi:hypothetical protein